MKINIIVAMTKNNVIGNDKTIPWKIKEDMQLFKEKTIGSDSLRLILPLTLGKAHILMISS